MKLLDRPVIDQYGVITVAEYGGWFVQAMSMLFNDRIVLAPVTEPRVYDYGWCFPKGGAAGLALLAWNPDTEGEPVGYTKAINGHRQPGEKAA